jgi:hypothetical protein
LRFVEREIGRVCRGLTHSGFYRHFYSKGQLVAEAYATGMECVEK